MQSEIYELSRVPVREVWSNEATDFTPWLAENVDRLARALGLELELEGREVPVGPFFCDLVCVDLDSNSRVVVENMLHRTDHDHLGKLLTYAAGLEADYAVLVADEIRSEHRSALAHLNTITRAGAGFFGVELHAVRIGSSPPALDLDVVVKPDDWVREVAASNRRAELSPLKQAYASWFEQLMPALHDEFGQWAHRKPPSAGRSFMSLASRRTGFSYYVSIGVSNAPSRLRVEVMCRTADEYQQLVEERVAIDEALPGLIWETLEGKKGSRVASYYGGDDNIEDTELWQDHHAWVIRTLKDFSQTFQPIIDKR